MGRRLVWCWALHCVRAARLVRDIALAELHGAVLAPVVNLQAGERRLGGSSPCTAPSSRRF